MSKIIMKLITAGEGGVGKTTLLHRYVEGKYLEDTKMTIGVEFFMKELEIEETPVVLQLWDFGGQQRFRFTLESYSKGAKGALLMFDLSRPMSMDNLEEWVNICRAHDPDLPILLLGTKLDLADKYPLIEDEYALQYKDHLGCFDYLKISSKTGIAVNKAFELITKKMLEVEMSEQKRRFTNQFRF